MDSIKIRRGTDMTAIVKNVEDQQSMEMEERFVV